jgi:hypothetical protein
VSADVIVFLGPTLSAAEARRELDAMVLPPAAQGDVLRALKLRPRLIGIVDGYFNRVPAVWHKEILWAMAEGVHVFGGASMGALRAAELAGFGMIGVGSIFRSFFTGELEDDDEVAVAHAPSEANYAGLSEAMVNIRATVRAAVEHHIIDSSLGEAVIGHAKQLPYWERRYDRIVAATMASDPSAAGKLTELRRWILANAVDQKKIDARAMLRAMAEFSSWNPDPKQPDFVFEYTDAWDSAVHHRRPAEAERTGELPAGPDQGRVMEEVQLLGSYHDIRVAALGRALAVEAGRRVRPLSDDDLVRRAAEDLCRRAGLSDSAALLDRLNDQGVRREDHRRHLVEDGELHRTLLERRRLAVNDVTEYLRSTGRFRDLADRAQRKSEFLRARGLESPESSDAGVAESELWQWYFGSCLREPVPPKLELFAGLQGFESVTALRRAVLREYLFRSRATEEQTDVQRN